MENINNSNSSIKSLFKNSQEIISQFVTNDDNSNNFKLDYLKRENSNNIFGIQLLNKQIQANEHEKFLMDNIFPDEIVDLFREGVVYIHDRTLQPYCVSVSCKQIALEGVPTRAKNMLTSKATKDWRTFLRQISNIVVFVSQQVSGAVMLSQMTSILASYLKYSEENLDRKLDDYYDIYKDIKHLIWELNLPLRHGSESSFSNITLEFGKPSDEIKNDYAVIGSEIQNWKYSDIEEKYFNRINKAIIDVMSKGSGDGQIFTFPLMTVPMDDEFDFENEMYMYLLENCRKFGGFYAENFKTTPFENKYYKKINPLIQPKDTETSRSMCCMDYDSELTVYDSVGNSFIKKIGELKEDYDKYYIDSLNPNTLKIEKVKICGFLKKALDNHMYSITTESCKTINLTGDHIVLIINKNDDIIKLSTEELYKKYNNNEPFMIPVVNYKNLEWEKVINFEIRKSNKNPKHVYDIELEKNHYFPANGIITHNCRLQINLKLLSKIGAGLFGSSTGNTGAVSVINLNMNRLFLERKIYKYSRKEFFNRIKEIMEFMQEAHQAKREFIENNKDLYPTFFALNKDLKNYFNVFSIMGIHEGLINFGIKGGLLSKAGKKEAHLINQYIHEQIELFIEKDGVACGLEYAPGENAAVKMARNDISFGKKHNFEVYTQGTGKDVFLTSGSMLPFSESLLDQIENSAQFQSYATSGSILHHFFDEVPSPEILSKYIDNLFENKPIQYLTISPNPVICQNCFTHLESDDYEECPNCQSEDISTFGRVIGYIKPISRKNIKKDKKISGEYNFWSSPRRLDWQERLKLIEDDLEEIFEEIC